MDSHRTVRQGASDTVTLPPEIWTMILDWLLRPVQVSLCANGGMSRRSHGTPAILLVDRFFRDTVLAWYFSQEIAISIEIHETCRCRAETDGSMFEDLMRRIRKVRIYCPSDAGIAVGLVFNELARLWAESHAINIITIYAPPDYGALPEIVPASNLRSATAPLFVAPTLKAKLRWDPTNFGGNAIPGRNLLWFAVQEGNILAVDSVLSRSFEGLNRMCGGYTPLQIAIRSGDLQIVERLIATGRLVLDRATFGAVLIPPLHLAAMHGRCQVVLMLLTAGADAQLLDYRGRTALQVAITHSNDDAADLLRRWRIA